MSLTLYWNIGSQPARAVKCLLDLGKIPVNLITLDVIKNQTRTKEYLSLNPLGQIPFIIDGDFRLAQSNAILVYLCEKYPQKLGKYYGNTAKQRAKVNQHISWYQNFFRPALFKLIYLKIYEGIRRGKPVLSHQVKLAQKQMFASIGEFEELLKQSGTSFAAGNSPTIADLQYYFEMTNLLIYEKTFSQFKLVSNWYSRVAQILQVKAITQQWSKLAPTLIKVLKSVPLQPNSSL